ARRTPRLRKRALRSRPRGLGADGAMEPCGAYRPTAPGVTCVAKQRATRDKSAVPPRPERRVEGPEELVDVLLGGVQVRSDPQPRGADAGVDIVGGQRAREARRHR